MREKNALEGIIHGLLTLTERVEYLRMYFEMGDWCNYAHGIRVETFTTGDGLIINDFLKDERVPEDEQTVHEDLQSKGQISTGDLLLTPYFNFRCKRSRRRFQLMSSANRGIR